MSTMTAPKQWLASNNVTVSSSDEDIFNLVGVYNSKTCWIVN
jgi:hypothetical protein